MSVVTADGAKAASTATFLTSLTSNAVIAGSESVAFIFVRRFIKALYEPRTYIPPREKQASVSGKNSLWPLWKIIRADPHEILQKNGVDPYVFVRFLTMMAKAMVPIWLVSWVVLLPVNSVNTSTTGKTGSDKYTFGNVSAKDTYRLWAHLVLDYLFIGWISFSIWGEMRHWLVIRQKHSINPGHSKSPQANTVLVTGISKGYMDEAKLEQSFSHLPGGVKRIWLNRNSKEMPDLWERRAKAAAALESAQVKLIKLARDHRVKTHKKVEKLGKKDKPVPESLTGPANPDLIPRSNGQEDEDTQLSLADQLVPRSQRPTKRFKPSWSPIPLGFLGIGQKVDMIEWAQKEIAEVEPKLQAAREQLQRDVQSEGVTEDTYPPLNSAFIHFNQQIAAHMAAQCLTHNQPYRMNRRYIEQSPENVIWRNLNSNPYEQSVRQAISYAISVGLIIAWTFPVAFIGALSSINTVANTYSWSAWSRFLEGDGFGKKISTGVITGVLPPVLLALLMLVLPIISRQVIAFEGIPSRTEVELSSMTRYFIFSVIHTFFIVTLTSGLIKSIGPLLENPTSIANTLANQMPEASTFFITLILTQFTGTAGTSSQPISLALYYIRVILGGGTPRSVFKSRYHLDFTSWGAQFPSITVYAVIMIGYCVISPIINGFGACFFLLSASVYKYQFIWVSDQPPSRDTGGLFFPKAITHVFVGIYIQEVCLCASFFLARNEKGKVSASPQAILMIISIVGTAAVHYIIIVSYKPLIHSLPLSLAHLSYGMPKETGHEGSVIGENSEDHEPVNSSTEHSNKPQKFISPPDSMQEPQAAPAGEQGDGEYPPEKQVYESRKDVNPVSIDNGEAGVARDFAFAEKARDDPHYPPSGNGSPTSAGPPIGEPHVESMEMGIIGQEPDPSNEEDEEPYFALPGGPGVVRLHEQDENDPNAFFHPATKEPMRVIWLPRDELGLCEAEIEDNARYGIPSVHRYATLNAKGRSQISGPPPDDF